MVQNCLHALEKKFVFRFAGTFHLFFTQKADCLSILATRNGKNSINVSMRSRNSEVAYSTETVVNKLSSATVRLYFSAILNWLLITDGCFTKQRTRDIK